MADPVVPGVPVVGKEERQPDLVPEQKQLDAANLIATLPLRFKSQDLSCKFSSLSVDALVSHVVQTAKEGARLKPRPNTAQATLSRVQRQ